MAVAEERDAYETLSVGTEGGALFAKIDAPPMNLLGPALVRDLVSLIRRAETDEEVQVLVFSSADPDYFISHVDLTQIAEYREEAAKLVGEPSIGLLFPYLSASPLVSIARQIPGGGAAQHLTRLMGRARALEVMLSADDYDADLAERYGWVSRALPAEEIDDFVRALARRVEARPADPGPGARPGTRVGQSVNRTHHERRSTDVNPPLHRHDHGHARAVRRGADRLRSRAC